MTIMNRNKISLAIVRTLQKLQINRQYPASKSLQSRN